jgi:hypothetical protein
MEQHMLLSQTNWNNDGLNQDIQREVESKDPRFSNHVTSMNKTNMNFGAKETYFKDPITVTNAEEDQDGSSTNTHKKKFKRFESSRFTAEMFDPDHGPSDRPSEQIEEEISDSNNQN